MLKTFDRNKNIILPRITMNCNMLKLYYHNLVQRSYRATLPIANKVMMKIVIDVGNVRLYNIIKIRERNSMVITIITIRINLNDIKP